MASLGYNVPLHRTLAFGFGAFLAALAGVLYAWFAGQVAPGDVDLPQTINLLIMAVIGGLVRIEGAWVGAFVFFVMQNYITSSTHVPLLGFGGTLFGGSFNTLIGIIFLAIVVVSPDGLMGLWGRLFRTRRRPEGGETKRYSRGRARELTTNRQTCLKVGSLLRENRAHLRNTRGRRAPPDEKTHSAELEDGRSSGRGRGCGRGLGDRRRSPRRMPRSSRSRS